MKPRIYHHYLFFCLDRQFRSLGKTQQRKVKQDAISILEHTKFCRVFAYSTVGLKKQTDCMFWVQTNDPGDMQRLLHDLFCTSLGQYLTLSYTLFGIVRESTYVATHQRQSQAVHENKRLSYLVIYPFTKTKEWYLFPFETRKKMMMEHITIGHRYAHIKQVLLYAFGVDDHEFIVSYEIEKLPEFQSLVMELRSSKARLYTQNDTPIFTCRYGTISEILTNL